MTGRYDPVAAPTIWRIPGESWEETRPALPPAKEPGTPGRPTVPFRQVLDGILDVLRTGCRWKAVPKEFGSGSTCRRRSQAWVADGTWERSWADQLHRDDAAHGIGWEWQSADSATVPSPLGGGTGPDPTNRAELGTQRHLRSDRRGAPLSAVVSAANRNGMKPAEATSDGIVAPRPTPTRRRPQHLCRDQGSDYPRTRQAAAARGYTVHTPQKGLDTPPRRRSSSTTPAAGRWSGRTAGTTASANCASVTRSGRPTTWA